MAKGLTNPEHRGLDAQQVLESREKYGPNVVEATNDRFSELGKQILRDPMVLLLIAVSTIYFVTGNMGDALFMLIAIIAIISISLYQDRRSRKALDALRALTQPNCRVLREGNITSIPVAEIVMGDYLLAEEGSTIAADGTILQANDFSVNESILTGESLPIDKSVEKGNNEVYQGTLVTRGLAVCKVTAIGVKTTLEEIGHGLATTEVPETPLQKQIAVFVRRMAIISTVFLIAVWLINLYRSHNLFESLLKALSLALSIIPEEIPVAFVTFMAVGAWRLSKLGIVVKQVSNMETLGSASVICVDKTGTITRNRMELSDVYVYSSDSIFDAHSDDPTAHSLIRYAMWASEPIPFDPMEVALHEAYTRTTKHDDRPDHTMAHEYPLSGYPPFMTHVFEKKDGSRIIAAKGAPEGILSACKLPVDDHEKILKIVQQLSSSGARVLGVASGHWDNPEFPATQNEIQFTFLGLVSFYDPPKDNMRQVLSDFYRAGISVKMITGDYAATAASIAKQIGLRGSRVLTGKELMELTEADLQREVESVNIFARTFPEVKLKILNALKKNGHVVAMTGDGINDAPALKAAHIGVAMGKRGTEVAKQASAIVLSDDDLSKMVDAVAAGRKIYANLKKAIQYIISIHIPIILTVLLPLLFDWQYAFLFTPVHVIFLELIMGPTCSIVYENEPFEKELMAQKPRPAGQNFFNWRELTISIIQGLGISFGALIIYQYSILNDFSERQTRAMVFVTLICANIFLTFVNRSLTKPMWVSARYHNPLIPFITIAAGALTLLIVYVHPVSNFFKVAPPTPLQVIIACVVAFISVAWIDVLKVLRRRHIVAVVVGLACVSIQGSSQDIQKTVVENHYPEEVRKFYQQNNYSLVWKNQNDIREFISFVRSVSLDGLDPDDYGLPYLTAHEARDSGSVAFDMALTRSFLELAHDLYQGRIDPDKLFPADWEACTTPADYRGLLSSALNGEGVCETLDFLRPMDRGYEGLKYMLGNFRTLQRNRPLPNIPFGDPIHPGDLDERVADIRTRLSMLGMLLPQFNNEDIRYDSILMIAVARFQRLHGLKPDGAIGRRTQEALQLTTEDYISTILANLEKYRWHQSRLLDRSIKINIPSFDLKLSDNERTELRMKVIIGRIDRPTPVISSVITAMIINPTWTVPPTILKEDLLPAVKTDVDYLRRHNMRVITSRGKEINADSLDWSKFSERNFPYQIQQDAGPTNPLGRIKFIFPNHHAVYLHDTNMPSLFASQVRAASSGCIRIESPMALVRLLTPASGWTEEMVRDQIEDGETRLILVKDPLPIHLTYFTAYLDNDELYVMKDLYGYDKVILHALRSEKLPLLR